MSANITSGLGGRSLNSQPTYLKKEYTTNRTNSPEIETRATPLTTIPQLHQDHEQTIHELKKAIDAIQGPQKSVEISVHKQTQSIMIKVMNKDTGDTIREIPSEKILDAVARMMEFTGIIVDEKI